MPGSIATLSVPASSRRKSEINLRRAGLFYSGERMTLPKMISGTFKAQHQKKVLTWFEHWPKSTYLTTKQDIFLHSKLNIILPVRTQI